MNKHDQDIYGALQNKDVMDVAKALDNENHARTLKEMELDYLKFERFRQLLGKLQSYGTFFVVTAGMIALAIGIDRYVRAVDLIACEADSTGEACSLNMLEGVYVQAWSNNRELATANVITNENGHGAIYPPRDVPREDIFVGPLGGYDYTLTVPLHRDAMGVFHPTEIYCYQGAKRSVSNEHVLPRPEVTLLFEKCTPNK